MHKIRLQLSGAAAIAILLAGLSPGRVNAADDPAHFDVTLQDHRFTPSEIHVQAGKPTVLMVRNQDKTAEEFDSSALKVEKVIAGGASGMVRLRPLPAGRYPFKGEFHESTAQGVVIAE